MQYHADGAVHTAKEEKELSIVNYEPPRLALPTLSVDTSNGYQPEFDEILSFAIEKYSDNG